MPFAGVFRPLVRVEWPKSTAEGRSQNVNGMLLSFTPASISSISVIERHGSRHLCPTNDQ